MRTIIIDLPHNKGNFEITFKNDRQEVITNEFLEIIGKYSLDIDKQDLENILHISSL